MAYWTLFPTQACANNCKVCSMSGSLSFDIHTIAATEVEELGLANMFSAIKEDGLGFSGGDPLMNVKVLELAVKYHPRNNGISVNPLSFLTMELHKPAGMISLEEAKALHEKLAMQGFSGATEHLIELISDFELQLSAGPLQSPDPALIREAKILFDESIFPRLRIGQEKQVQPYKAVNLGVRGPYDEGFPQVVGRLRDLAEQGKFEAGTSHAMLAKVNACRSSAWEQDGYEIYFVKEDNARLYFMSCCQPGVTPYTSFRSNLTLEGMAEMAPPEIRGALDSEITHMKATKIYWMLNDDYLKEDYGVDSFDRKVDHLDSQFRRYCRLAEDLLLSKGHPASVEENVLTLSFFGSPCEYCNTVGILLQRAGISRQEWQDYLKKAV